MSMMSAPSATIFRACASARSGAVNWPPSEKESGVTFRTPITAGYDRDSSAASTESPFGPAAAFGSLAGLEMVAIMRSLCAVRVVESRRERDRGRRPERLFSVADFRCPLARLLDQLFDRSFRGQNADQPALGVD